MPNVDNIKKWTAALRSGDYKQGANYLHAGGNSYCCLGVACEVYLKENPGGVKVGDYGGHKTYNSDDLSLPLPVQEWYGVASPSPSVYLDCTELNCDCEGQALRGLAELNDEGNWDFNQLADVIDREFGQAA